MTGFIYEICALVAINIFDEGLIDGCDLRIVYCFVEGSLDCLDVVLGWFFAAGGVYVCGVYVLFRWLIVVNL